MRRRLGRLLAELGSARRRGLGGCCRRGGRRGFLDLLFLLYGLSRCGTRGLFVGRCRLLRLLLRIRRNDRFLLARVCFLLLGLVVGLLLHRLLHLAGRRTVEIEDRTYAIILVGHALLGLVAVRAEER